MGTLRVDWVDTPEQFIVAEMYREHFHKAILTDFTSLVSYLENEFDRIGKRFFYGEDTYLDSSEHYFAALNLFKQFNSWKNSVQKIYRDRLNAMKDANK